MKRLYRRCREVLREDSYKYEAQITGEDEERVAEIAKKLIDMLTDNLVIER